MEEREVETHLGQIRKAGVWMDYARGHKAESIAWAMGDRANRRVVDWIDKDRIIWPTPVSETSDTATEKE